MTEYQEIKRICEMSAKEIRRETNWHFRGKWNLRQSLIWKKNPELWDKAELRAETKVRLYHKSYSSNKSFYKLICEQSLELAKSR